MKMRNVEFSRKLAGLSDDTIRMLSKTNSREQFIKMTDIIMTTDSEEEIVKKFQELMKE